MKKGKTSKSWREKLEKDVEPKIVEVPKKWAERIGDGRMLVPSPLVVDKVIRKIPRSKLATVNIIRDRLAQDFNADITCPLTTGIFLNIAANTAEEDKEKGAKNITPYWRVLKEDGSLNPKFPGGIQQQAKYLKDEGFMVVSGKSKEKMFVKDFDNYLVHFS